MTTNAQQPTTQPLPEYPCDICGMHIQAGEKFTHDPKGETTHNDCARDWFRRNFGREGL
jgi:hypothetical protein